MNQKDSSTPDLAKMRNRVPYLACSAESCHAAGMDPNSLIEAARQIAPAIEFAGVPTVFAFSARKAIGQLLGSAAAIPEEWLDQKKALVKAKGESKVLAEGAMARQAVAFIEADNEIGERVAKRLAAKEYKRQANIEAVAAAALEDLRLTADNSESNAEPALDVDDDWLNAFERLAEDASTERARKLWGKVLAGKIKSPENFSLRTMQTLPLISPSEAEHISKICLESFGDFTPRSKVIPNDLEDITSLASLESIGLIQGVTTIGLTMTYKVNQNGHAFIFEGGLAIQLICEPNTNLQIPNVMLTPLAKDLMYIMENRIPIECARRVAEALPKAAIKSAFIGMIRDGLFFPTESIWKDQSPNDSLPS